MGRFLGKINLIIREVIRDTLKITMNRMLHRTQTVVRGGEEKERAHNIEVEAHKMSKCTEILVCLRSLSHSRNTQVVQNMINKLTEKLLKDLPDLPSEVGDIIGGTDYTTITNLMNESEDHFDTTISFLEAKIRQGQQHIGEGKKIYRDLIQGTYSEDPKRCLRWYITSDTTPECTIDPDVFARTYGEACERSWILDDDNEFAFDTLVDVDDNVDLLNEMEDDKSILDAISSRSNLSAHGPDGISNFIWKME